jgi:DNA-binding transcriptional MerR regulator
MQPNTVRIGELSRRVGVSDHVLRAWETRYGLLTPVRSSGGFRLYSDSDERRIRRMQYHLAQGLSAAEAARTAIAEANARAASTSDTVGSDRTGRPELHELARALQGALDDFDEGAAQSVLDRVLSEFTLATTLRDVVVPYLHELGERWGRGEISIAQEHFASNVIRGRLAGLARGWGTGQGPRAFVACPPDELHDLPLLIFGIVLNRSGWRVHNFGASTPIEELFQEAGRSRPELVVVAATTTDRFTAIRSGLAGLAAIAPLALAGAGATQRMADEIGARLLTGDPVTAAQHEGLGW